MDIAGLIAMLATFLHSKRKGVAWFGFITGLITLCVGIALMYILPEYIIGALNSTGTFSSSAISTATQKADQARALGFVVVVIGLVWMVIGGVTAGRRR